MNVTLKSLACMALAWTAPIVCLVYRKGWYATPDDLVSPHGAYEKKMRDIYKLGKWAGDYWWHGWRNRAYGLAYAFKPEYFKFRQSYVDIEPPQTIMHSKRHREIRIAGYSEHMYSFWFFHVIRGYRLRPIRDEFWHNVQNIIQIPYRPINMDARPILSIRAGAKDD